MKVSYVEIHLIEKWAIFGVDNLFTELGRAILNADIGAIAECEKIKRSSSARAVMISFSASDIMRSAVLCWRWLEGLGRLSGTWQVVPPTITTTRVTVFDEFAARQRRQVEVTFCRAVELYGNRALWIGGA